MANRVVLGLCGGFHAPQDTEGMLQISAQDADLGEISAFVLGTAIPWAPLSAHALRQSLDQALSSSRPTRPALALPLNPDLILWAFSAGGVGAVALAHHWQRYRGRVRAIFLVDGWGVPWAGAAPLHRISHDSFTHQSSRLLGAGRGNFVADPAVPHLHLWRNPQTVMGWGDCPPTADPPGGTQPLTAAEFLTQWTRFYARLDGASEGTAWGQEERRGGGR